MDSIWERLTDPELLFGLMVRFFGVFAVLIIIMIGIWLSGLLFIRLKEKPETDGDLSGEDPPRPSGKELVVPDEVAAAISLSLEEYREETGGGRPSGSDARTPAVTRLRRAQENPWKITGRQESVSRALSWRVVSARNRR